MKNNTTAAPSIQSKEEVTGIDDKRPKPANCYAVETGQGNENCVFPACHCGLPQSKEEGKQWERGGNFAGSCEIWEGDKERHICTVTDAEKDADLIASAPHLKARITQLEEMERQFYMDICRAYNAGKQNMVNITIAKGTPDEGKMFLSSHDYFITEFPDFKTNVP